MPDDTNMKVKQEVDKKLVPLMICLVALLSFFIVKGVGRVRENIEKGRIQRNIDWLERCQKIRSGMSYRDVVSMLGAPEYQSQSGEGGDFMMFYRPPIPGFSISPEKKLVVSEFVVDLKDARVTYFTLGYE